MRPSWETHLDDWIAGGVVDAAMAERVRAFEASRGEHQKLRWPILLALAFGGLLVFAGILLVIAAHWDGISPAMRFVLVLLLVAGFHVGGVAAADRFPALATVLHALGTGALGGGIYLAGQIFNMQGDWPAALLLWAVGAWTGWILLRDWPQAAFAALLTPAWLIGKWSDSTSHMQDAQRIVGAGLLLLAISYLTTRTTGPATAARRALVAIGAIALLPCAFTAIDLAHTETYYGAIHFRSMPGFLLVLGWSAAYGLPLLLAWWARGRAAWINVVAALWVWALVTVSENGVWGSSARTGSDLGVYSLCALGSVALVLWGLYERHKIRLNLGVAGFAVTVLMFYFSDVMSKLDRASSLIGLGILFLLGGYLLERARRNLVARMSGGAA